MTKKEIKEMYRQWRKDNANRKPNRAIVKMHWEDDDNTDKGYQIDTIGLEKGWEEHDNPMIIWYSETLDGILDLVEADNGSGFIVDEVLEFYKQ